VSGLFWFACGFLSCAIVVALSARALDEWWYGEEGPDGG